MLYFIALALFSAGIIFLVTRGLMWALNALPPVPRLAIAHLVTAGVGLAACAIGAKGFNPVSLGAWFAVQIYFLGMDVMKLGRLA